MIFYAQGDNKLNFRTGGSGTDMSIDSSGNVGIGTTSPNRPLEVDSGTGNIPARFRSTDANSFIEFVDSATGGGRVFIGTPGTLDEFAIFTAGAETVRVDNDGNVGIGTDSPNFLLDIVGSSQNIIELTSGGSFGTLIQATQNSPSNGIVINSTSTGDPLVIEDSGTSTFIVKDGGNVGVGIDSPGATLDVVGTIRVTDNDSTDPGIFFEDSTAASGTYTRSITSNASSIVIANTEGGGSVVIQSPTGAGNSLVIEEVDGTDWIHLDANANILSLAPGASGAKVGVGTTSAITTLDVDGGFAANIVAKTEAYTATTSDHTITCGAGNESFTVTLPAVAGVTGLILNIKNVGTGTITVDGASSETIDGATTAVISTQFDTVTIQCDGTEWWVI